jgi:hypothetical protein
MNRQSVVLRSRFVIVATQVKILKLRIRLRFGGGEDESSKNLLCVTVN